MQLLECNHAVQLQRSIGSIVVLLVLFFPSLYMTTITINIDSPNDALVALEKIVELVKQGYTSGYEPYWSIDEK